MASQPGKASEVGRILILEPQAEVRELVERVAKRLGHESVTEQAAAEGNGAFDAIVLEPASPPDLTLARALHERSPEIPLVCTSISPPTPELRRELSPRAFLTKPFSLGALEQALIEALQHGD